jgi:hypothetical protein
VSEINLIQACASIRDRRLAQYFLFEQLLLLPQREQRARFVS